MLDKKYVCPVCEKKMINPKKHVCGEIPQNSFIHGSRWFIKKPYDATGYDVIVWRDGDHPPLYGAHIWFCPPGYHDVPTGIEQLYPATERNTRNWKTQKGGFVREEDHEAAG